MLQLEEIEAAIVRKTKPLHDKLDMALAAVNPAFAMEQIMSEAKNAFAQAISELKVAVVAEFDKLKSELQVARNDLKTAEDELDTTKNELSAVKATAVEDHDSAMTSATAQIKDILAAVKAEPGDDTGKGNGIVTEKPTPIGNTPEPGTPGATLGENDPTGPVDHSVDHGGIAAGDPKPVPAISETLDTAPANTSSANAGGTNGAAVGTVAS